MKSQTIVLKQVNMLCHRCVMNVIRTLSQIPGVKELNVDLESQYIKLKYVNSQFTKGMVKTMIKDSIEGGKYIHISS